MKLKELLLFGLLFIGLIYIYIISRQGSMAGYIHKLTNVESVSKIGGTSKNLVAEVFYYPYQEKELSDLFYYLNYYNYIVKKYPIYNTGYYSNDLIFRNYVNAYGVPYLLPMLKIGKLFFYVEPAYINSVTCPYSTEYVHIGDKTVELCKVNTGVYLLTFNSLSTVTMACKETKASICYD